MTLSQRLKGRSEFMERLVHSAFDFYRETPAELEKCITTEDYEGIGRLIRQKTKVVQRW